MGSNDPLSRASVRLIFGYGSALGLKSSGVLFGGDSSLSRCELGPLWSGEAVAAAKEAIEASRSCRRAVSRSRLNSSIGEGQHSGRNGEPSGWELADGMCSCEKRTLLDRLGFGGSSSLPTGEASGVQRASVSLSVAERSACIGSRCLGEGVLRRIEAGITMLVRGGPGGGVDCSCQRRFSRFSSDGPA